MAEASFVIFHAETGRIVTNGSISAEPDLIEIMVESQLTVLDAPEQHEVLYESGSAATHYVSYGEGGSRVIVMRPAHRVLIDKTTIVADGVDTATLSVLPATGEILVDDNVFDGAEPDPIVLSGQSTWTFAADTPGTYTITVRSWPTLDAVFEVTAT